MQTWREVLSRDSIDNWSNFSGVNAEDEHLLDWYMVCGRSRDSNTLEESNFASMLRLLGDEQEGKVAVVRIGHWAVGWIEEILINPAHPDTVCIAQQALDSLENYPVLDDDDFSSREWEEWEETYENCLHRSLCQALADADEQAGTFHFSDGEGTPELTEEQEQALFEIASENASRHSYESWDKKSILRSFLNTHFPFDYHPDLFEKHDTRIIDAEVLREVNAFREALNL